VDACSRAGLRARCGMKRPVTATGRIQLRRWPVLHYSDGSLAPSGVQRLRALSRVRPRGSWTWIDIRHARGCPGYRACTCDPAITLVPMPERDN
jgi:hypothetical protein